MESELRLIILDAGLPTPSLQYEVIDGNGELRRLDFAWPEYRGAMEYDGVPWHQARCDGIGSGRRRLRTLVGW